MPDVFFVEQDGPITIHRFADSSEGAIDAWEKAVVSLVEHTPLNQRFLLLMDVSSRQVSFTRYARQKTLELFSCYRERRGRIAFLFTSKTAPHFARIFFATLDKLAFEHEYFSSREKATNWLLR